MTRFLKLPRTVLLIPVWACSKRDYSVFYN